MSLLLRMGKHARIYWQNLAIPTVPSPPFLILFVTSTCNMRCEHCFYWRHLNTADDLSLEELTGLSEDLGRIENLYLSGGEPFLRHDLADVCRLFIHRNRVAEIYIPTNGYYTERTVAHLGEMLKEKSLRLVAIELSLDGTESFHDAFRGAKGAFRHAMETYDALVELQRRDARLQIHAISTATEKNMEEIRKLTAYLYERCPHMAHHNLAIMRGDHMNPTLRGPALEKYVLLYDYIRRLWAPRELSRYGAIVEPMLQWAKVETARQRKQIVPCRAGILGAVVYANGDVSLCEQHVPRGNLRRNRFREIWRGEPARELRRSIRAKQCYCTNEMFLWPSITFQPFHLLRVLSASKAWQIPSPLSMEERIHGRDAFVSTPHGGT